MKFLCDVHISFKLVKFITENGFECIHVNEILDKWFTSDNKIMEYVDYGDFVLISKDLDFKNSHFIKNTPKKLIKINLGNISNNDLIQIFSNLFDVISETNIGSDKFIIEINQNNSIITKS